MKVKIKKLNPNAQIPQFGRPGDGCQDVVAVSCKYNPKYDRFEYGLGFATEFDSKYRARLCPRSSNTKTDAYIPNPPGCIDSNYRGEWLFMYKLRTPFNILVPDGDISKMEKYAPYNVGNRIGQVYFEEVIEPEWEEVEELSESNRGADGGLVRDDKNFK